MKELSWSYFIEYSPQHSSEIRRSSGQLDAETMFTAERLVRQRAFKACGSAIIVHELTLRDSTGAVVVRRGSSENDGKSSSPKIQGAPALPAPSESKSTVDYATDVSVAVPIKGFVNSFLGE